MYRAYLVILHSHYIFWTPASPLPGTIGDRQSIPLAQTALLSLVLKCASGVHISLANFCISLEFPRDLLLQTYFMDALVRVGGVFSGHYLVNGRATLLTTLI